MDMRATPTEVRAELDFRHLLLAHGEPVVDGGRDALATFAG